MAKKKATLSGLPDDINSSMERRWNMNYNVTNRYPLCDVHKGFLNSILNDAVNLCIVNGPAGSAKTYIAALGALLLLGRKDVDEIVYVRSVVESASNKLGSLPGDVDEKFHPWAMPLVDKLNELLLPQDVPQIMKSGVINCIPVNFLRGLTFRRSAVIVDECQNMTHNELVTVLTRFGMESKYFLLGDTRQSDIGRKSGFQNIITAFDTEHSASFGIKTFTFTNNEIVRHPLLSHICEVLDTVKSLSD